MDLQGWLLPGLIMGLVSGFLVAGSLTAFLRHWARRVDSARRRAEALLGNLPTPMVALDQAGRVLASNAAAEELWAVPLPRGLRWLDLLRAHPWLDAQGVRLPAEAMPLLRGLALSRPTTATGFVVRPGTPPLGVTARVAPLVGVGGHRGVVCTFERIAAPQSAPLSETLPETARATPPADSHAATGLLLEEIWDALPEPALVLAEGGQVVGINEAARRFFSLSSQAEALGPAAGLIGTLALCRPDGRPLAPEDWAPVQVLKGSAPREETLRVKQTDGTEKALASHTTLFTSAVTGRRYAIWLPRQVGLATAPSAVAFLPPAELNRPMSL